MADLSAPDAGHFESLYRLGVLRGAEGRLAEALVYARQAVDVRPNSSRAHAQLGGVLALLARTDEALEHLQSAHVLDPTAADVLNNIGGVLRTLGRLDEARGYFERAVTIDPSYRDALRNLGNALSAAGCYDEAIRFLSGLIGDGSESAALYDELGKSLWKVGRIDEAERAFRRAVALDEHCADAWAHLGNMSIEEGRLDEAESALLRAIAIAPRRPEFYGFLASANASAVTAEHAATLEDIAAGDLSTIDFIDVHFALGRITDAAGLRRKSFEHFAIANREKRAQLAYDETATFVSFRRMATVFSADFMRARRSMGNPSELPIFIVGMPRSGTTLIEQALASHQLAYGAGELDLFESIAKDVLGPDEGAANPFATDSAALRVIGDRYVAKLQELAPSGATRVTDKMPDNFKYAGLIHIALPNARIIHVVRDPVDTGISCFTNAFASDGLAWTYDLGEIGRRYREYRRLMAHWNAALPPGAMLEVRYEHVVANFEAQARRIVAHCGLAWDPRVLEFHRTKRSVKTASAAQVRRPIYRASLERARDIEDLIAPLREAIDA